MEATQTTKSRARAAELVALYFLLPALLTLARLRFHSFPVIPVLWLAMAPIAVWLVRRRGFAPRAVLGDGGFLYHGTLALVGSPG